jgi:hypothetical protein
MSQSLFGNISMEDFLGSPHTGLSLEEAEEQLTDSLATLDRLNFSLPRLEYLQAGVESSTEELSVQTISVIDFALEALVGPEHYAEISTEAISDLLSVVKKQAGELIGQKKTMMGKIGVGIKLVLGGIIVALIIAITALVGFVAAIVKLVYTVIKWPLVWVYRKATGSKPLTMPQSLANKLRFNNIYLTTVAHVLSLVPVFAEAVSADPEIMELSYTEVMGIPLNGEVTELGDNPLGKIELSEKDIRSMDAMLKDQVMFHLERAIKSQKKMSDRLKKLKERKDLDQEDEEKIREYKKDLPKAIKANRTLATFARQMSAFLHPDPKGKENNA